MCLFLARDDLASFQLLHKRDSLHRMMEWWIGIQHDFQVSTGALGKHYQKYMPTTLWERYASTYTGPDYEEMWDSIFTIAELFRELSLTVASHFDFKYPFQDEQNMIKYLQQVRFLPDYATRIFL